jgi:CRISPR-associated protein (TIGR03986 family)
VYGTGDPEEPTLATQERAAYAGRIRLTHGRARHITGTFDATLSILSSPKPTTTRFYLRPIDDRPRDGLEDRQVDYSEDAGQRLRGRKVYRHQGDQLSKREYSSPGGRRTDQNRTVEGVVKPQSIFEFELEFENLAEIELGALLWSLEMEGWNHRLGLAKPLGFGSVTIEVEGIEQFDPIQRYEEFRSGWEPDRKEEYIARFKAAMEERYGVEFGELDNIRDLNALLEASPDLPVHYPRSTEQPQPDGKNYEWFMGNKRKDGPKIALPLATEDTEGLPLIKKSGKIV